MLEFLVDHYLIIMIVSVFLIFALIGYIIDQTRNKKRNDKTEQILETKEDIPDELNEPEQVLEETGVEEQAETVVPETPKSEEIQAIVEPVVTENMIPEVEESEDNS